MKNRTPEKIIETSKRNPEQKPENADNLIDLGLLNDQQLAELLEFMVERKKLAVSTLNGLEASSPDYARTLEIATGLRQLVTSIGEVCTKRTKIRYLAIPDIDEEWVSFPS